MKALPLTYAGVHFRSRLEADWAANLDAHRIAWDYEPEGFELSDGTRYSPDFYLPELDAWLEVKGPHNQRVSKVEQFAADLWADAWRGTAPTDPHPLILLGQPRGELAEIYRDGSRHRVGACHHRGHNIIFSSGLRICRVCWVTLQIHAQMDDLAFPWTTRAPRPVGGRSSDDAFDQSAIDKWLRDYLELRGSATRKEVMKAAYADGWAKDQVDSARRRLGVVARRVSGYQAGTVWELSV